MIPTDLSKEASKLQQFIQGQLCVTVPWDGLPLDFSPTGGKSAIDKGIKVAKMRGADYEQRGPPPPVKWVEYHDVNAKAKFLKKMASELRQLWEKSCSPNSLSAMVAGGFDPQDGRYAPPNSPRNAKGPTGCPELDELCKISS